MALDTRFPKQPQLREDVGSERVSKQPTSYDGVRGMYGHVKRRQPVSYDSLDVARFEIGQRGKIAVTEGKPVIVVPDV